MMRVALLVLALTAVCNGILPEIVNPGVSHILEDHSARDQFVEVEQLPRDPQHPEDASHQRSSESVSVTPEPTDLPAGHHNHTAPNQVTDHDSADLETNNNNITTTRTVQYSDLGNSIDHGCISDDDCGKGRYCVNAVHSSKCMPCKATDVSCTTDGECCGEQLCMWGQCSQNATKGEAGSTCQYQSDCSPELCCALHKALLFSVCSAKPIERERCFGASNHLMELLSWDSQGRGPRKHCPCAGELHCQHLGRGSMCLKREDSSEEDLSDTLYSEIDYII